MAETPSDRRYTEEHEWAMPDPDAPGIVLVGITDYAQEKLGDIVMVELPSVDETVDKDAPFGSVESPKSVSDVFAPVSGRIVEVNEDLGDSPELVNDDPYGEGWLVRIEMDDPDELKELMNAGAYKRFLESEAEDEEEDEDEDDDRSDDDDD